jgi:predicted hydrocarbon binding protein
MNPSVKRQHVSTRRDSGPERKRQHIEKEKKKKKTCDACDGDHDTDNCPHYSKKGREMAKELMKKRRNGEMMHEIGDDGGHFVLRPQEARVVRI